MTYNPNPAARAKRNAYGLSGAHARPVFDTHVTPSDCTVVGSSVGRRASKVSQSLDFTEVWRVVDGVGFEPT